MPTHLVYVEVPRVTTARQAFLIDDEADLKVQLKKELDLVAVEVTSFKYKPERDEKGKVKQHLLGQPGWDVEAWWPR